ncbi:zinc transporter ZupT [Brevibacterium samyangense]|uniref:Zinc transporter ZupT n=1 Tax=Brevibacterium samyangense TaxID=366888 RepID=A0ABN2T902_9MICO
MNSLAVAFLLTLGAGLATGLGGLAAVLVPAERRRSGVFLGTALGFSAGVMVYVSFVEILPQGIVTIGETHGPRTATALAVAAFFAGILATAVIDRLVPARMDPHPQMAGGRAPDAAAEAPRTPAPSPHSGHDPHRRALLRTGMFTAFALALHNFPEGFATFLTSLQDAAVAIPIVVAIAVHNIPEGIAVAVPIHHATGSKRKALGLSFLSGLAEPAGAVIGYLLLAPFITPTSLGMVLAAVAGVMVFLSFDQLLPTAQRMSTHRWSMYGLLAGMAVMAVSLVLLA